ncbi:MAG: hypothetical protein DHS20C14_17960 [Phycisphaeraceae bacterium]|nr:MAG: hypothetical protein DHS20C14_17960 [Phycisphaeraceae bacterium]
MLTQTLALFLDAYRELNAKKLFWITLLLSGLVVLALGALGIDDKSVSIFGWRQNWLPLNTSMMSREIFYTLIFSNLGIGLWLSWIATILALVSTAGIVPDLISGGSIETVLSKPISRLRLLLTKLGTGLLFVALQVGVFSLGCFLVFGIRAGVWNFGLFLAIPIVVLFYSYLFSVCALLGMVTRSTVAALLLTVLLWGALFLVNMGDGIMLMLTENQSLVVEKREARIDLMQANTVQLLQTQEHGSVEAAIEAGYAPSDDEVVAYNPFLEGQFERLESDRETLGQLQFWTRLTVGVKTALPKTGETIDLLERHLVDPEALQMGEPDPEPAFDLEDPNQDIVVDDDELSERINERLRGRSIWWIVGTSLIFEFVMVGITCLLFVRRDF